MYDVNKILRVAVNMILNGSTFPSGRIGVICKAVGDIATSDAIFAASKRSLGDISLFKCKFIISHNVIQYIRCVTI